MIIRRGRRDRRHTERMKSSLAEDHTERVMQTPRPGGLAITRADGCCVAAPRGRCPQERPGNDGPPHEGRARDHSSDRCEHPAQCDRRPGSARMSAAPNWTELDRRQRRHEVMTTTLNVVLIWALLFGIYYLVPFTDRTSAESLVRLASGGRLLRRRAGLAAAPGHATPICRCCVRSRLSAAPSRCSSWSSPVGYLSLVPGLGHAASARSSTTRARSTSRSPCSRPSASATSPPRPTSPASS